MLRSRLPVGSPPRRRTGGGGRLGLVVEGRGGEGASVRARRRGDQRKSVSIPVIISHVPVPALFIWPPRELSGSPVGPVQPFARCSSRGRQACRREKRRGVEWGSFAGYTGGVGLENIVTPSGGAANECEKLLRTDIGDLFFFSTGVILKRSGGGEVSRLYCTVTMDEHVRKGDRFVYPTGLAHPDVDGMFRAMRHCGSGLRLPVARDGRL